MQLILRMGVIASAARHVPISGAQSSVALIETQVGVGLRPLNFEWFLVVLGLFDLDHIIVMGVTRSLTRDWWRGVIILDEKCVFCLLT